MEFVFEEPTIKKVKVTIEPCPCCGSEDINCNKHYTGNGADTFGGYAWIKCNNCNHMVKKESNNIGWGDTLEGLFNRALAEWNGQAKCYGKSNRNNNGERIEKMQSPGENPFNMEKSLQEIERQVEIAITSVKKMEKYDGIWHPNAKKGVSLPLTDAVVIALHAILGTARQIRSNIEET